MEEEQSSTTASLKNKLKQTLCPSNKNNNNDDCLRLPEIRNKCRDLINRISFHRRRCSTVDFKYDPLSYALNFDDGGFNDDYHYERIDEAAPLRNFTAGVPRLPIKTVAKPGITCM
ncbi:hypothetical protein Vadar_012726 [Vaccinium darrowii]|uniref:Uncharacterized protein n=1 Tax=Vaccinium darrowii TaxID=229202 RepID=A0ACB7Z3U2_9ERIC|nr:hypothetical protein Vadar_012726 [Vaccinium darrowii]